MFNFPWKLHLKDWILVADSDTADKIWGGMLTTYIAYVSNDLVRFLGGKQIGFMPAGEVLNGLSCMLSGSQSYTSSTYTEDAYFNRMLSRPIADGKEYS